MIEDMRESKVISKSILFIIYYNYHLKICYHRMHCEVTVCVSLSPSDACDLTFDPNTANSHLTLSDDNKKAESGKEQKYSANPLRFDSPRQVLCKEKLTGQHYWEVEWSGHVRAGVAYSGINRKGTSASCNLGQNHLSWALDHEPRKGYSTMYNSKARDVTVHSDGFKRLGVFLDKGAGTLSFYMVSSDELHHIHTFRTKFSEPLYPAFRLGSNTDNGQVKLL